MVIGALGKTVLIELEPKVSQHIRRIVGVSDGLRPGEALFQIVKTHPDAVVSLLLPVTMTLGARSCAIEIWGWQDTVELAELVGKGAPRVHRLRHDGGVAKKEYLGGQEGKYDMLCSVIHRFVDPIFVLIRVV